MPTSDRVRFLDVDFDRLTMDEALGWLRARRDSDSFAFVVTPNVDHLVRLHSAEPRMEGLAEAYRRAALCLCDSRVLQRLARLFGIRLTIVPGSDLSARLFDKVIEPGEEVTLVGGDRVMVARLSDRFPGLSFRQHIPPMGLAQDSAALDRAAAFVTSHGDRFTFLAVGSPQQEMVALRVTGIAGSTGTALCVGASLDFLAGTERRAPRFLRAAGMEWAFRLAAQPRRMWRRYLVEGPRIFAIAWRWRRSEARR